MKIHSVGTTLLQAGRRTHMTKLFAVFRTRLTKLSITNNAADFNTDLKPLHYLSLFFSENLTDTFNSFCYTYRIFRHVIILIFDEEY
jgi:hypothetical protein